MTQLLVGDSADNIPGVRGIGPKKSEKLLLNIPFDKRWTVVKDQWRDKKQMEVSARLLWMATSFDEAECGNESMLGRLEAKTLEEFWAMEVADEQPTQSETSECEPDVREEGKSTFKTPQYLEYQNEIRDSMMGTQWQFADSQVKFTIDVGLSNRGADVDNVIKPLLDTYQAIFEEFNDNKVYHIDITKSIVKRGDEYINVTVEEYNDNPNDNKEDNADS